MPNKLFGSVGFALSADRRRPKTLAGSLTKVAPKDKSMTFMLGKSFSALTQRRGSSSQLATSRGKLTEPRQPSLKGV
jgi:hypothetical protein